MVSIFFQPSHILNNNICNIFLNFKIDRFSALQIFFFNNFVEISPENRVLKVPKMRRLKNKNCHNCYYSICVRAEKKLTPFWPVFKPFFNISPEYFAIVQKAPILHFWDPSIIVPLGK